METESRVGFEFIVRNLQFSEHADWLNKCSSQPVREILETATRCALAADPVLIVGECGTGKQQLAHHIYRQCRGDASRFVRVACGELGSEFAISRTSCDVPWLDQLRRDDSHNVTWLFDRVDEIPLAHQSLVSRLLDEIRGSDRASAGPSVISTARPGLNKSLAEGTFREDLYYKLNVLELAIPPLRERKEDIPALLDYFLESVGRDGLSPLKITSEAVALLREYHWPGNVAELRNVVSKVSVLSQARIVDSKELLRHWSPSKRVSPTNLMGLKLEDAETHLILEAISRCDGNKTAAAKQLGITARTLHNKMQKYRTMGFVE